MLPKLSRALTVMSLLKGTPEVMVVGSPAMVNCRATPGATLNVLVFWVCSEEAQRKTTPVSALNKI